MAAWPESIKVVSARLPVNIESLETWTLNSARGSKHLGVRMHLFNHHVLLLRNNGNNKHTRTQMHPIKIQN